jgi:hypothetical protein
MRLAFAVSSASLAVFLAGCTSLLGDFETGGPDAAGDDGAPGPSTDASDASSDGSTGDSTMQGSDGASQDGPGPSDAQPEADAAPLQRLTCDQWQKANDLLVARLFASDSGGGGGNNIPFNQIAVEHIPGMNAARLVVATNGSPSATTVYTVQESSGSNTVNAIALPNTGARAELKTSNAVTFLVQQFSGSSTYLLYSIADSDPGNNAASLSTPVATLTALPNQPTSGGGGGNFEMTYIEMAANSYYLLATYAATGGQFDLSSWLTPSQTSWQVVQAATQQLNIGAPLVRDGTNAYGFFGPPGSGGGGPTSLFQYTFPTNGASAPTSRSIIPSTATAATMATSLRADGSYSLAFVELAGAQSATVHAGSVPRANINSFMVDDLPALTFDVKTDGGLFDTTPFSGHNGPGARWLSNGDLGMLGTGGTGGGTYTGLNFYVATPTGQWLVATAGTGQNVLAGQTIQGSAFDLANAINDIVLQFDMAWVVQLTDGSYGLYFNQLNCHL